MPTGGVTDVVLALGFKPEPFRDAFPDGRHGDVRVHYAVEPEPLDTAGAIAFAAREAGIDETFVVANGDIVTDLDVTRLVDAHRSARSEATIHLTPVADPSAFGVVETDPTGVVRRFVEKPAPGETESNLINAGTYVLEPSVLDLIEPGSKVSIERDTFPRLVAQGTLAALATDDYWIDAGRPSLYLRANLDLVTAGRRSAGGRRARDRADGDGRSVGALRRQRRRAGAAVGCRRVGDGVGDPAGRGRRGAGDDRRLDRRRPRRCRRGGVRQRDRCRVSRADGADRRRPGPAPRPDDT